MRKALALLVLVAVAQAVSLKTLSNEEWLAYKLQHRKKYSNDVEEDFRKKIFYENSIKIAKHNQLYAQGKVSFKLGLNKYVDMLHHEFTETMNGFNHTAYKMLRQNNEFIGLSYISPAHVTLPKSVDWRKEGVVTEIKDQGQCGSCWAFSATGALEAQHARKTGVLVSLSEQNLIDCSVCDLDNCNQGCNGGFIDAAFSYIKVNGGIDTEKSYPYEGIDDSCHFKKESVGATESGFVDIPQGDEYKLMEAVATTGPVSVAIDASHQSFLYYTEGIYDEPKCSSLYLDHAVLVVGYGTDENFGDYWLVKNSWGTTWGENGYIRMSRNKDNQCGIATCASFPTV